LKRLRDLYYTVNITQKKRKMRWPSNGEEERCVNGLVRKPEVKRLLGKSRYV